MKIDRGKHLPRRLSGVTLHPQNFSQEDFVEKLVNILFVNILDTYEQTLLFVFVGVKFSYVMHGVLYVLKLASLSQMDMTTCQKNNIVLEIHHLKFCLEVFSRKR
jgi:hypothetical protein